MQRYLLLIPSRQPIILLFPAAAGCVARLTVLALRQLGERAVGVHPVVVVVIMALKLMGAAIHDLVLLRDQAARLMNSVMRAITANVPIQTVLAIVVRMGLLGVAAPIALSPTAGEAAICPTTWLMILVITW